MKPKLKTCSGCGQEKVIWKNHEGGKYCKSCWAGIKYQGVKPKPRSKIKPKSKKQEKLDAVYSQLRRVYLEKNPNCQASLPGCTRNATEVHHKSLRGDNYLVVDTWCAICRSCHTKIHLDPKAARELGLLV